jgi:hypothetical protein
MNATDEMVEGLRQRLTEILAENEQLKSAVQRTPVKQVIVDRLVDNPLLVEKVKSLTDQVEALEKARLSGAQALKVASARVVDRVVEKEVERIVHKLPAWAVRVAVGSALAMSAISGAIGFYVGQH